MCNHNETISSHQKLQRIGSIIRLICIIIKLFPASGHANVFAFTFLNIKWRKVQNVTHSLFLIKLISRYKIYYLRLEELQFNYKRKIVCLFTLVKTLFKFKAQTIDLHFLVNLI